MRGGKRQKRRGKGILVWIFFLFFFCSPVQAQGEGSAGQAQEEIQEEFEKEQEETRRELLQGLELEEMQEAINGLLGRETFSVSQALERILDGEEVFSKEFFWDLLREFLYSRLAGDRTVYIQALFLALLAALFANFTNVFGSGQAGEISFYVVYMLLLAVLIHSFGVMSQELADSLKGFVTFMQALMPSYFLAVTAASGAATAMVLYEAVLAAVYFIQIVLLKAALPGIHAFVLLELVNFLHSEDFLSKLAELLKTLLEWTLKTCTGALIGMQILQNMISPALDSLKRDMLGKTAAALPGIGNAVNSVTEVALGTAALIRNCLGVTGIVALLLLGLPPIIKLGTAVLLYKFLAALIQPVSDKRMVGCLSTMGEGCRLLLKVLLTVELLLLITIAVLSVSFVG